MFPSAAPCEAVLFTLAKGYSSEDIATNSAAMKYRQKLETKQEKMAKTISKKALGGEALDVVWNLTLAANIISANVEYGQIEKIEKRSPASRPCSLRPATSPAW